MNKENPTKFDKLLQCNFEWKGDCGNPKVWKNVEYLGIVGDHYLYWAYEDYKENGVLYRTKINNTCEKCGQEVKE